MSNAITAATTMTCPHGGVITLVSTEPLLMIDNAVVYTVADLASATIKGCTNTPPCAAVTDAGATLLTVNNSAVLIVPGLGTDETPPPPAAGTVVINFPTYVTLS